MPLVTVSTLVAWPLTVGEPVMLPAVTSFATVVAFSVLPVNEYWAMTAPRAVPPRVIAATRDARHAVRQDRIIALLLTPRAFRSRTRLSLRPQDETELSAAIGLQVRGDVL